MNETDLTKLPLPADAGQDLWLEGKPLSEQFDENRRILVAHRGSLWRMDRPGPRPANGTRIRITYRMPVSGDRTREGIYRESAEGRSLGVFGDTEWITPKGHVSSKLTGWHCGIVSWEPLDMGAWEVANVG